VSLTRHISDQFCASYPRFCFDNITYEMLINDSCKLRTISVDVLLLDQSSCFNISKEVVMYNSFIHGLHKDDCFVIWWFQRVYYIFPTHSTLLLLTFSNNAISNKPNPSLLWWNTNELSLTLSHTMLCWMNTL